MSIDLRYALRALASVIESREPAAAGVMREAADKLDQLDELYEAVKSMQFRGRLEVPVEDALKKLEEVR